MVRRIGGVCPQNSGKIHLGKYHVKFGHFVNFSCIYFDQVRGEDLSSRPNAEVFAPDLVLLQNRLRTRSCSPLNKLQLFF